MESIYYTETRTLSSVSNSGKTLTVSQAFTTAPEDQIWILSRPSQTGKKNMKLSYSEH